MALINDVVAVSGLAGGALTTYYFHNKTGLWFWPVITGLGVASLAGITNALLYSYLEPEPVASPLAGIMAQLTATNRKPFGAAPMRRSRLQPQLTRPIDHPMVQAMGCVSCF